MMQFHKIGLALAFSPRTPALLAEAARLKRMWNAELILIHVGDHGEKERMLLAELLKEVNLYLEKDVQVFWESGKPSERVLSTCKRENVDLLIAGALKKENLVQYYLGTVARKFLRKSDCSVLMLTDPSTTPHPFKDIVVNAEDSPFVEEAVR
ncbi:MAG TPA: universal stress protein, partial [Ohtaekwangia sp.]|uniref:universal stress protein n=1 Tax=Ohtaekwangia sp. TaxID=2066019 RepID=UPI002F945CE1